MQSPEAWFLVLVVLCIAGSYAFGVRPTTRRQWASIAVTLAFSAWLLLGMTALR